MTQRFDPGELGTAIDALLEGGARTGAAPPAGAVEDMLQALRESLGLDVVFVSEFTDGQRVFRFVDRAAGAAPVLPGSAHPLALSLCQRVVDGRLPGFIADVAALAPDTDLPPLPVRVGTHLSTPIVLDDGRVFGTLCGFSSTPHPARQAEDLDVLRRCARLVARKLEHARASGVCEPPAHWAADPQATYRSNVWRLRGAWALAADGQRAWLDA